MSKETAFTVFCLENYKVHRHMNSLSDYRRSG